MAGCGDVLSLEDLQTAKKHQIFEAEVITGKTGGVAGGAYLPEATNPVTGQVQKTMPAILRDIGIERIGDFTTGCTVTARNQGVLEVGGSVYVWLGALPKVVPAASTPGSTGGIYPAGGWSDVGDASLRNDLASQSGADIVYWSQLNSHSLSMTVASRLRKKIYASDLGITTLTSASYNSTVMQEMINESSTNKVAIVFDVSCDLSTGVILKSNCVIFIPQYVTLRVANGVDSQVLYQGTTPGLTNVYIEGGTLDGNQQNAPRAGAYSVTDFGVCGNIVLKGVTAKNGSGYGFAFQARPQSSISAHLQGIASNIIFDDCHAISNGVGAAAGGDTYDGFDIKYVEGCILRGCSAVGNSDKGFDPRGERVFMDGCWAVSNGTHGFGFSASFSDTGYPVKGSIFATRLFADSNGGISFYFTEGVAGNAVRYSFTGGMLIAKSSGTHGFRVEAQNADILVNGIELRGSASHAVYVTSTSVNSMIVNNLLIRDCNANGITIDPGAAAPIQFSNIDVIAQAVGMAVYSPEAVVVNGGRLSGITNGPIRIDAAAAVPILNGVVDGDITYKKGDVIANTTSALSLKLGMEKVIISSTSNINTITPIIENREVSLVSSGSVTYQNSSAMVLKTTPTTISDGMVIKFVCINGKWRQI